MNFAASWFTHLLRPASLLALLNGPDPVLQPSRASTSRLSAGRSPFLPLDMTTTATGLLVWGFFCQEVSAEWRIFLPSSASLFDLKARFFVSDPKPSRAGEVCTIECSRAGSAIRKLTIRGEPAFERGSIAPQPCIRWVQGPEP